MKRLLLLAPTERERRDLPALARALGVEVIFDRFDDDYFDRVITDGPSDLPPFDLFSRIETTIERVRHLEIDGVTSAVGYPGMSAAAIIANRLALPGPAPRAVLLCEHKYYSRCAQSRHVPQATPRYFRIDPEREETFAQAFEFPLFLKPIKSCMSMNAFAVRDAAALRRRVHEASLPQAFVEPFNALLRRFTDWPLDASGLLLEELLRGHQVSVEGYAQGGRAHVLGIIDAVMYPGTHSFARFRYPSMLEPRVLSAIEDIARRFIEAIDYGDALFNIEMMWDPASDRISIIEVNPKIASQFPDLFEKVDGCSTYTTLMEVALGIPVSFRRGGGKYQVAASCVLRTFEDRYVERVPSASDVARVYAGFPDARVQVFARPGRRLSQDFQDPHSFRYALVNLGAQSESDLLSMLDACKQLLPFELLPCVSS